MDASLLGAYQIAKNPKSNIQKQIITQKDVISIHDMVHLKETETISSYERALYKYWKVTKVKANWRKFGI